MDTPTPLSPDVRVNTFTPNFQENAAVAALPDGGYVLVWMSADQEPSDTASQQFGIFGQRYDAAGNPQGGEFHVNTTTAGSQDYPAITTLSNGDFLVAWTSTPGSGGGPDAVYGQLFTATGAPSGGEVQLNTQSGAAMPSIAALPSGGYVATWTTESANDVHAQVFSSTGARTGAEITVNTNTVGTQGGAVVAALPSGDFVVSWVSYDPNSFERDVYAQAFNAAGQPLGAEHQVNATSYGEQPAITALGDGGYVIAWTDRTAILAQRYDASGAPQGGEFQISADTHGEAQPSLSPLPDGGFVATWVTANADQSDHDVFGQRFDAAGHAVGAVFQVDGSPAGAQLEPTTATLAGGDLVVAWTSYGQDPSGSIYERRFDVPYGASDGADSLAGTAGADTLDGRGGDDTIDGRGGVDLLLGGAGNDLIREFGGSATIDGGSGDDIVQFGSAQSGLLIGGDGDDDLSSSLGSGDATLQGGAGNDYLAAGPGDDILVGGPGDDLLAGGGGANTFVFDWTEQVSGTMVLFRDGQHPSANANGSAWAQYDRQAAERGFTAAAQQFEGHTLWGQLEGSTTTFQNQSGVDTIGGFNFAHGDRIEIDGVTDLAAFRAQVAAVASAQYGDKAYDLQIGGQTFMTVYPEVAGTPYSPDWFV